MRPRPALQRRAGDDFHHLEPPKRGKGHYIMFSDSTLWAIWFADLAILAVAASWLAILALRRALAA